MQEIISTSELKEFLEDFKNEHSDWNYSNNKMIINIITRDGSKIQFLHLPPNTPKALKREVEYYNTFNIWLNPNSLTSTLDNCYFCWSLTELKLLLNYLYENMDNFCNSYSQDALNIETIIY